MYIYTLKTLKISLMFIAIDFFFLNPLKNDNLEKKNY